MSGCEYALKYYLNESINDIPLRPDHYLLIDHIGTISFAKEEGNVQHFVPVKDVAYNYTDENGSPRFKAYIPFYMAEYPEDGVKVVTAE